MELVECPGELFNEMNETKISEISDELYIWTGLVKCNVDSALYLA